MTAFIISSIFCAILNFIFFYFKGRTTILENKEIRIEHVFMAFYFLIPMLSQFYSVCIILTLCDKYFKKLNRSKKLLHTIFLIPKDKRPEIYEGQVSLTNSQEGKVSLYEQTNKR